MQNIGLKLVTRCLFPRLASVQSSDIRHTGRWAAGQLGGWAGRWNQLRQTFAPDTHQSRSRSLEPEQ